MNKAKRIAMVVTAAAVAAVGISAFAGCGGDEIGGK